MSMSLTRTASSSSVFSDASDRTQAPNDKRLGLRNPSFDDSDREISDVDSGSSCISSASTETQAPVKDPTPLEDPMNAFVEACGKVSECWRRISMGLILSFKAHERPVSLEERILLRVRVREFSRMLSRNKKNTEVLQSLFNAANQLNNTLDPETNGEAKKSILVLMSRISSLQFAHQKRALLENKVTANLPPTPTVARIVLAVSYLFFIIWVAKESLELCQGKSDAFAPLPSLFNSYKHYLVDAG